MKPCTKNAWMFPLSPECCHLQFCLIPSALGELAVAFFFFTIFFILAVFLFLPWMFYPFGLLLPPCSLSVFQPNSWWFSNPLVSPFASSKLQLPLPLIPDLFILPLILGFRGARLRQVNSLVFKWVRCLSLLSAECSAIYGTCCQWTGDAVALMRLIAYLLLFVSMLNWQQQPFKVNTVFFVHLLVHSVLSIEPITLKENTSFYLWRLQSESFSKITAYTSIIIHHDSL